MYLPLAHECEWMKCNAMDPEAALMFVGKCSHLSNQMYRRIILERELYKDIYSRITSLDRKKSNP